MALTVEDGTGLAAADSYVAIADVEAYEGKYETSTDFVNGTSGEKEVWTRRAAQLLDEIYGRRWKGSRAEELQGLDWPRMGVTDRDGYSVEDDEVPTKIKRAQMELAIELAAGTDVLPNVSSPSGAIKRTRDKVGSIETEVEYAGAAMQSPILQLVDALVADYVSGGANSGSAERG